MIKEPVWTWEIPLYFVAGGVSGASAGLAFAARLSGNGKLAERTQVAACCAIAICPPLLISDLGRPGRFLNMLRVFKPSSPMSIGSWLLAANSAGTGVATLGMLTGRAPRLTRAAGAAAAALGMPLTTYTAVLIANTAVPVWHEARHELPFVFGGGSAAGAGALAVLITPHENAGPARRLAAIGTLIEGAASQVMERRLGDLAGPIRTGQAGRSAWAAKLLATTGALLTGVVGSRRPRAARAGAGMVLAGEIIERWSVFRAGFQSAADPGYTVGPQRIPRGGGGSV